MHVEPVAAAAISAREVHKVNWNVVFDGGPDDPWMRRIVIFVRAKHEDRLRQSIDSDLNLVTRNWRSGWRVNGDFDRINTGLKRVQLHLVFARERSGYGVVLQRLPARIE